MNILSLRKLLASPVPPLHTHYHSQGMLLGNSRSLSERYNGGQARLHQRACGEELLSPTARWPTSTVWDSTSVYSYDSQGQLWQELPDCHTWDSALVMAANKLTTVGGYQDGRGPTNSLASLTGEGKDSKWVELFPRMPTARYDLAAVCRGRNVIAAGGRWWWWQETEYC